MIVTKMAITTETTQLQVAQTPISTTAETYVTVIHELGGGDRPVGTQSIADALAIAAPSVTEMLRRLKTLGLVTYQPYRGAQLTHAGILIAQRQRRRHRLISSYLEQTLGFDRVAADEEAALLEHHLSNRLLARIGQFLGDAPGDSCRRTIPPADQP